MRPSSIFILLRVYLGVIFALAVLPKLRAGPGYPDQLHGFLLNFGMQNAHPFYRDFLSSIVLPHVTVFAALVVIGEAFVALALVTGTATRLAAVVAMLLLTNYMFAKGLWWWYPSSNDGAFFAIALALVLGGAVQTGGLDAMLAKRWPKLRALL